jgi:hypothetical protein
MGVSHACHLAAIGRVRQARGVRRQRDVTAGRGPAAGVPVYLARHAARPPHLGDDGAVGRGVDGAALGAAPVARLRPQGRARPWELVGGDGLLQDDPPFTAFLPDRRREQQVPGEKEEGKDSGQSRTQRRLRRSLDWAGRGSARSSCSALNMAAAGVQQAHLAACTRAHGRPQVQALPQQLLPWWDGCSRGAQVGRAGRPQWGPCAAAACGASGPFLLPDECTCLLLQVALQSSLLGP